MIHNILTSFLTTYALLAPDPPVDLSVSQNGMNSVLVSWTPATTGSISPTGYTITLHPLQDSPGEPVTATAGPTDTSTTVFDLIERAIYSVSIVANSNTLSSNITGPENVTIGNSTTQNLLKKMLKFCVFFWVAETVEVSASTIPSAPAMIGDTVTLSCTADLPDGVVGTPSFQWEGQGVNSQGSTLIVSPIELSHAGRYTCTVTISFFNISDSTDIIIQGIYTQSLSHGIYIIAFKSETLYFLLQLRLQYQRYRAVEMLHYTSEPHTH